MPHTLFNKNFSRVRRLKIDKKLEQIQNIFKAGKFKQIIKITMIDVSCKNLLPKECRDI